MSHSGTATRITNKCEGVESGKTTVLAGCKRSTVMMMTKTGGGVTKFNPALSSDSCYTLHLPTEVDIQ